MNTLKTAFIALAAILALLSSSCNKHTCPTYSQAQVNNQTKA